MERFKRILVAASPGHLESTTLQTAIRLAESNEAHLTILDVVGPLSEWHKRIAVEDQIIDVEAALLRDRREQLWRLVDNAGGGHSTKIVVQTGEPFVELIRHVVADGHDLVMLGGGSGEDKKSHHLSSGVMKVLRKCPVPVWVMRPSLSSRLRVLALVDPDSGDTVRDRLNDMVVELATSVAKREGGELHVGHAWRLVGEGTLRTSAYVGLPGPIVDRMVQEVEAAHRSQIDFLAERHCLEELGATVHMVSGEPRKVLPRLAEQLDVGLIVMGTVARTGLSGLMMGNTAETILRSVRCSVLAVKPEGFVTPIKLVG